MISIARAWALIFLIATGACLARHDELVWPDRLGSTIVDLGIDPARLMGGRVSGTQVVVNDDDRAQWRALAELIDADEPRWERFGSFLFRPLDGVIRPALSDAQDAFVYVSAEQTEDGAQIQRTWFTVQDSTAEPVEGEVVVGVVGVVIVLPGMFGTPVGVIDQLVTAMREDGWVVIIMLAHPTRFTERVQFQIDLGGDLDAQAQVVADELTGRAVECAFAVEAAFDRLLERRPELFDLPRVAVGMSGGAMVLPTVVALEPEEYDGAVFIAGGVDFWRINLDSNYADWIGAVDVEWSPAAPTPEQRRVFDQAYLRHAPLDSFHTASLLADMPTLMIHGTLDRAVPAELGDELWNKLGNPERIEVEAGHELVFWTLETQHEKILAYLRSIAEHVGGVGVEP